MPEEIKPKKKLNLPIKRIRFGLLVAASGFLIFLIGVKPDIIGMDRSPVLGFIQISVMLVGLGVMCMGGYISINGLWKGRKRSIAAELGIRIISTGYIIALFSGLADVLGQGSHPYPEHIPYFGIWQARGFQIAEGIIAIGILMMLPYARSPLFNGTHTTLTEQRSIHD
ncbi:MAG: hypothetical protein PWQ55_2649 [Chloroflexota bacterium]|nr:hypothetical protein [Chloroflexota bacterium]